MKTLLEDHAVWLKDPAYREAYDGLAQEFAVARALIDARIAAGLTQTDVAIRLGVTQPAVARMESGKNISLKTITRYANAVQRSISLDIMPVVYQGGRSV